MSFKKIAIFIFAVSLSLLAAVFRWDDSAHSIGVIRASGGEARHPVFLGGDWDRCNLISTATVIPPYRGDMKVVLEGQFTDRHITSRGTERRNIKVGLHKTSVSGRDPGHRSKLTFRLISFKIVRFLFPFR